MHAINLSDAFSSITDAWTPKIIGELNGQHVKIARFDGPFVWHSHEHEDELFLVVRGRIRIEFRDRTVELNEGEMCIVPRGVEHKPVADEPADVLLFEPASTVNTGDVEHELRIEPDALDRM